MQLYALEPLFKIFFADKYVENLKQASGEILAQQRPPKFDSKILCYVALVYSSYFFQNSRFTEIIRH